MSNLDTEYGEFRSTAVHARCAVVKVVETVAQLTELLHIETHQEEA